MSLSTLTTIAAVREHSAVTKAHVGKQSPRRDDAASAASLGNLLVSSVPTELVAPYTALTAVIVGSIAKATRAQPHPNQYEGWRWAAFAILLLATAGIVWGGALRKGLRRRGLPSVEIAAAVTAAAGWALALPNSPLTPHLGSGEQAFVPAVIAFAAVALTAVFATGMRDKAKAAPRRRRAKPAAKATPTRP